MEKKLAARTRELAEARTHFAQAVERETATSEVLRVISSSPGELEPVFRAMLANAMRICDAKFGLMFEFANGSFRALSCLGVTEAYADFHRIPRIWGPDTGLGQLARTKQPVHVADAREGRAYENRDSGRMAVLELGGVRTFFIVPMLKEGELIGAIAVFRQEVRPFTDKQVELVTNFAAQAVIAIENTRLLNELRQRTDDLSEALEQQTATSEVLGIISSSPGELEPVFQAMLANAVRICEAKIGTLYLREGDGFRTVATQNAPPAYVEARTRELIRPPPDASLGRILATKQAVQIADVKTIPSYLEGNPFVVTPVDLGGYRTTLAVPMLKDNELIGAITINRQEVRPFTDKQIELVKNFAAQAVIAIENTRLLNELRKSLQQQTATADVLKVISRSAFDLQRVLETLLESAVRLCGAKHGMIFRYDGETCRAVAACNTPHEYLELWSRTPIRADRKTTAGRALLECRPVHIPDVLADPEYNFPAAQQMMSYRTVLAVPLLREGVPLGVIGLWHTEVAPFTDKQIELVTTFADQAVIAIENVRLFDEVQARTRELAEALEQQTATSEVLQVISSSPGELEPVFQALLENAVRICGAKFGNLLLYKDDAFHTGALYGAPPAWAELRRRESILHPGPNVPLSRAARTKQVLHIADVRLEQAYIDRDPVFVGFVELGGARTLLVVPMLKDDTFVGVIGIYRHEVQPFTDKQIELVENFAAQAVIAIENTRLLKELRQRTDDLSEALEQQTATSEVLRVISSSPGDLAPVFQAMLENAVRICEAKFGTLFRYDGEFFHRTAWVGTPPALVEFQERRGAFRPPTTEGVLSRVFRTKKVAHSADSATEPNPGVATKLGGARSIVGVPMLKDDELVGAIVIYRQEVRPFSDKQIELVQNFAAQAVIAIENTRLLNELRESLQQQTATSEVLGVISSSPGELGPVFQAMLKNATRICEAEFGNLLLYEGNTFRIAARIAAPHGAAPAWAELQRSDPTVHPHPTDALARVVRTKRLQHVADIRTEEAYVEGDPSVVGLADVAGARTVLVVPMLKENELIGVLAIYRKEVRPFTDKQIELVTNFAHQAVIAIENTRLLNELRESLQQQTATADVLKVISRSAFDLQAVLDTLAESAARLCEADRVVIAPADGRSLLIWSRPVRLPAGQQRDHVEHLHEARSRKRCSDERCWRQRPFTWPTCWRIRNSANLDMQPTVIGFGPSLGYPCCAKGIRLV